MLIQQLYVELNLTAESCVYYCDIQLLTLAVHSHCNTYVVLAFCHACDWM